MIEEWIDIKNFEGYYQISSLGRVKSLNRIIEDSNGKKFRKKGKILKPQNNNKYYIVTLSKNSKETIYLIHNLVYHNFIGILNKEYIVDHINNNKKDNRLINLQEISPRLNAIKDSSNKSGLPNVAFKSTWFFTYRKNGGVISKTGFPSKMCCFESYIEHVKKDFPNDKKLISYLETFLKT